LISVANVAHAFVPPASSVSLSLALSSPSSSSPPPSSPSSYGTRRFNFFKDAFDRAFENDRNLAADKRKGQYDAPGQEYDDPDRTAAVGTLTATQRAFREKMQLDTSPSSGSVGVRSQMLVDTAWALDLYLAGVPERDPSNDLFGSRVNISSRDKETGLSLPSTPSASLTIELLEDGICKASSSGFTSGKKDGQWKLSDDGNVLRFSIDTVGYTRRVETKGSIQKIYWTDEKEKTVQTSTTYSIPPGFVYGDISIFPGRSVGTVGVADSGVLRLEQSAGLLGIASRMVACGKFTATKKEG
jgi:hypothetical protein